jgi:hypothetical protein
MSPTLSTLLRDPAYKAYFRRQPVLPKNLYHPAPFRVWGLRVDGRWAGKAVPSYPEGFELAKKMLRSDSFQDVSISSRVVGFKPPENLRDEYRARGYDWCIMCRRPTHFAPKRKHHALRDDLHRYFSHQPVCPYCGIREETMIHGNVTIGKN